MKLMGILMGFLLYLEVVYHFGCFGLTGGNPVLALSFALIVASVQTLIVCCIRKRWKKRVLWIMLILEYVCFFAQFVYLGIFKQPLLLQIAIQGGGDALTNYWREALTGVLHVLPFLLLMAMPFFWIWYLLRRRIVRLPVLRGTQRLHCLAAAGMGIIFSIVFLVVGKYIKADYYEEYMEFFDPLTVAENMGVTAMIQRDVTVSVSQAAEGFWESLVSRDSGGSGERGNLAAENDDSREHGILESDIANPLLPSGSAPQPSEGTTVENPPETDTQATEPVGQEESPESQSHELPIDWAKISGEASSKEEKWLTEYIQGQTPAAGNEYTGLFEGYNLIFLTAEGFSPYGVREDITPTLYRLIHSGFVFTNYYVPLWNTSTSDGEYVNLTGLIPDGQFSMRKSRANDMAFSLARYFSQRRVGCMAYHDGKMDYYERQDTHNNLGYLFKAAKLGNLSAAEWGDRIFPMEHPDSWPASDLEMMQGTVPEYIGQDSFHVYYMTVSGHMNYSFTGNSMSRKNKDAVSELQMSENALAYIACHVELDKALEYLLQQLEAAGKLENTVICLSADHYPYAMERSQYDELAGRSTADYLDMYRNNLILWNAGMEDEPVIVDKVCGAMDLMPTLLNLFGFQYDSRLFAGRDIFSDEEGMVIFNDRSFVTDTVVYDRGTKTTTWREDLEASGWLTNDVAGYVDERGVEGILSDYAARKAAAGETGEIRRIAGNRQQLDSEEAREQYFDACQQEVKDRYQFSAYILQKDYYRTVSEALPEQYRNTAANPALNWTAPAGEETPPAE